MADNTCIACGRIIPEGRHICLSCGDYDDQQRFKPDVLPIVRTNGDRIRQMTDEELSAFLGGISDNCSYNACDNCPMYGACVDVPLSRYKWLKQEVSEDAGTD